MRIVHLTDLHYDHRPRLRQLLGKRLLGAANLRLGGRAHGFGGAPREQLVQDVLDQEPDLVIITGDLSTLGTDEEFQLASVELAPLLQRGHVCLVAGNHDRYTRGSAAARRMEQRFGAWMGGGLWDPQLRQWKGASREPRYPVRFDIGELSVIALDTARPDWASRGRIGGEQVERAEAMLRDPALADRCVILAMHYPLLDREGRPYTQATRGLVGVDGLLRSLARVERLDLVLHGHDHHWRIGRLPIGGGRFAPIVNGGSSGLAEGSGRSPGYFVFQVGRRGLQRSWRRAFHGGGYRDEPVTLDPPDPLPPGR